MEAIINKSKESFDKKDNNLANNIQKELIMVYKLYQNFYMIPQSIYYQYEKGQ